MSALLELNNVSRLYTNGEEDTLVLDQISLTINADGKWSRLLVRQALEISMNGCLNKPAVNIKWLGNVADMEVTNWLRYVVNIWLYFSTLPFDGAFNC